MPEIAVDRARTAEERLGVYRLRYQVYVRELGLVPRFADHAAQTLAEPVDEQAHIFYARMDGRIVGSLRLNLGCEGEMEHEALYDLDAFRPFHREQVAMATKLVITRDRRGGEVARALFHEVYRFGRRRDVQFAFIDCWPHLINLYEHVGFRRYRANIRHPEAGYMTPMVLVTEDVEHLERVRSPLLTLAAEMPHSDAARDLFAARFPDFARRGVQSLLSDEQLFELLCEKISGSVTDVAKVFAVMSAEEARIFARSGNLVTCRAGDRIISFGEMRREIYTVLSGRVEARTVEGPGGGALVGTFERGDTFGEVAHLAEVTRTANVIAVDDCELLVHDADRLEVLERRHPRLAAKVYRNLARIVSVRLLKSNAEAVALRVALHRDEEAAPMPPATSPQA